MTYPLYRRARHIGTNYEAGIEEQLQKIDAIPCITEYNKNPMRRYAAKIDALDKKFNTRTKHLLYMGRCWSYSLPSTSPGRLLREALRDSFRNSRGRSLGVVRMRNPND